MPQTIPLPLAASSDHGSLAGLPDDDHPQYLRLDGSAVRNTISGSVTFDGGTLFVTDGAVIDSAQFQDPMVMVTDSTFTPGIGGQGKLGTTTQKWGEIHADEAFVGDLIMSRETENGLVELRLTEFDDRIDVLNVRTGRTGTIPIVWHP
jgi:hypothetical protein